jgi:hypothetical protein
MRGILDDLQAVATRERQYFGHVAGEPGKVDRHDRLAARRQTALRMIEIDAAGAFLQRLPAQLPHRDSV